MHTILFLAANPSGANQRALDREANSIRKELKRSGCRDRFELVTRWAMEPLDLLRELRELKPAVVHFSGHGCQDGLYFQTVQGDTQAVSPAAVAETFGAAGASVKLVVLSACYSETSAEALLAYVDCVVGMSGALHDDVVRSFAIGFYGALGENESVAAAYQHGNAAIRLEGLADLERPLLKVRNGTDATQLVLAAVAPAVHAVLSCPSSDMRPYPADGADHVNGSAMKIDDMKEPSGALARSARSVHPALFAEIIVALASIIGLMALLLNNRNPKDFERPGVTIANTKISQSITGEQLNPLVNDSSVKSPPNRAFVSKNQSEPPAPSAKSHNAHSHACMSNDSIRNDDTFRGPSTIIGSRTYAALLFAHCLDNSCLIVSEKGRLRILDITLSRDRMWSGYHVLFGEELRIVSGLVRMIYCVEELRPPHPGWKICDERSCLLNNYEDACCAEYKKGKPGSPGASPGTTPTAKPGDLPEKLDRAMIFDGVAKVKAKVMACGDKSSAKGTVKVSVKVSSDGNITSVSVVLMPDAALGSCVVSAMQRATFCKTQSGGSFDYPFVFFGE